MRKITSSFLGTLFISSIMFTATSTAGPDESILFRQTVMQSMGNSARVLMAIREGNLEAEVHFATLANNMDRAAGMVKDAFSVNTIDSGARSRTRVSENDLIWTDWEDFIERTEALKAATSEVARLANAGDIEGAKNALGAVFDTCRGCHDKFQDD